MKYALAFEDDLQRILKHHRVGCEEWDPPLNVLAAAGAEAIDTLVEYVRTANKASLDEAARTTREQYARYNKRKR